MTLPTYAEIYAEYSEKVLSYLESRTESREDAEDICEDVFEQVYRSLPRYDMNKASISTWIYQITRFTFIDYIRTKRPSEPLDEEIMTCEDLDAELICKESLEKLASALMALDEELRTIIILRYYNKKTLTEISGMTGISYGMVRVKHNRALSILRSLME